MRLQNSGSLQSDKDVSVNCVVEAMPLQLYPFCETTTISKILFDWWFPWSHGPHNIICDDPQTVSYQKYHCSKIRPGLCRPPGLLCW